MQGMDARTAVAYFLYVQHGVLPHTVEHISDREVALAYQFMLKWQRDTNGR